MNSKKYIYMCIYIYEFSSWYTDSREYQSPYTSTEKHEGS